MSGSIIEKLGYVPTSLEPIHYDGKHILIDVDELKEIIRQRDEMLEAMIEVEEFWDEHRFDVDIVDDDGYAEEYNRYSNELDFIYTIIQKATGKTWEEIKELTSE